MSNEMISDADRQAQTLISEQAGDQDAIRGVPVEGATAASTEIGEVEMPETADLVDDEDTEEEFTPRSFKDILAEAAGADNVVRLVIRPELHFVVNLFHDEAHAAMVELGNYEFNDQKLNVIQPLTKKNDRSGRIGVLREPMRQFVDTVSGIMQNEERIVVTPDTGSQIINSLVNEFIAAAEATMYANFPRSEIGLPVLQIGEDTIDAENFVRVRALGSVEAQETADGTALIEATVKFIVHMRLPLLLREESASFDKTLKTHFKYLQNCGIKAGMPTAIFAAFYSQDLIHQPVMDCFNWIRENGSDVEILSYRNIEAGGDFFGIQNFDDEAYEESLFNGGDFIVSLNLENEGE